MGEAAFGGRLGGVASDLAWSLLLARADHGLVVVDRSWRIRMWTLDAQAYLMRRPVCEGDYFWRDAGSLFDRKTRRRFRRSMEQGGAAEAELQTPSGDWLHVELVSVDGAAALLARDATREERSKALARREQERTRALNESLSLAHRAARAATWEWRAGESLRWTDLGAARALVGIFQPWTGGPIPDDWIEMVVPDDRGPMEAAIARLVAEGEGQFAFRVRGADGALRWLEASALVAERDDAGRPVRLVGVTIDITERRAAQAVLQQEVMERRRAQERQKLLIGELNHRVKNTLATVQSIARQSLRGGAEIGRCYRDFEGRLLALSWAHDVLTAEGWSGANLGELVEGTLRAHQGRIAQEGPPVRLAPQVALAISLALHELATNALKYGALAREGGEVAVRWKLTPSPDSKDAILVLEWRERGGPEVAIPERTGFGLRLLRQALSAELGAPVDIRFEREGLVCVLKTSRGLDPPA
ncbi:HWE histidine kinase domain-containing protein [Phenylobacterium sp.]|uniref:sensor histidine kinase n=1 Tax=Phenylobacterium sp. TaxID=1871053 RepID=UPI002810ADF4|nr:HWE histidine kinase domain-containing protein [Phenylobacterium sp.]